MVKRHYRVHNTTQVASQKTKRTIQVIFPLQKKKYTRNSRTYQSVKLKLLEVGHGKLCS